jgi:methionine biosynthesis protein MetW
MRFDLEIIASWIEPKSRVLDLGCGTGDLLVYLRDNKQVTGTGIELSEQKVVNCIDKGLSVLQGDINKEVEDYADHAFDFVILSQTLQQVYQPDVLINELLRIGNKVVVSFPDFSHWGCRLQLFFGGRAPKTKQLPYEWYNTPNIRVMTLGDFRRFTREKGFQILKEVAVASKNLDKQGNIIRFFPNLRATYGIMLIGKRKNEKKLS